MVFNHITLRVPGPPPRFLINPFGLNYREVTRLNLVKVGLDGAPLRAREYPVNRAGFVIHSASMRRAPTRIASCIPTRPPAWRSPASASGLGHDDFYGAELFGDVAYHEFEGDHGARRRESAAGGEPRRQARADPAQPRAAGRRQRRLQRVPLDVDTAARVRGAGRRQRRCPAPDVLLSDEGVAPMQGLSRGTLERMLFESVLRRPASPRRRML